MDCSILAMLVIHVVANSMMLLTYAVMFVLFISMYASLTVISVGGNLANVLKSKIICYLYMESQSKKNYHTNFEVGTHLINAIKLERCLHCWLLK